MNKLFILFVLLFSSMGMLFGNDLKPDTTQTRLVFEEEEEHDEDEHEDDEDEHDDEEEFDEEEFQKFLKDHFGFAEKLGKQLHEDEHEEFIEEIEELYLAFKEERDDERETIELKIELMEIQSYLMGELIRQSNNQEDRQSLSRKLAEHLNILFDLKLKSYHMEMKDLSEEIREMQKMIEKRKHLKGKIIEMQMFKLTNEDEVLEW